MCICHTSLSEKREDVFKAANKDELLINFINDYKLSLIKKDIEIFEQVDNILITSEGYYIALKSEDLTKDNPNV